MENYTITVDEDTILIDWGKIAYYLDIEKSKLNDEIKDKLLENFSLKQSSATVDKLKRIQSEIDNRMHTVKFIESLIVKLNSGEFEYKEDIE